MKNKAKGLGDTIAQITETTGIKALVHSIFGDECGCEERREKLNKLFPYKKIECLTEDEYNYLKEFNWNVNQLTPGVQSQLLTIYNRVFNEKRQPTSCGSCWQGILAELHKVYNEYNDYNQ